jgi:hypothetical protein
MAVHGDRVPDRLVESSPLQPGEGLTYNRAKHLAEEAVWEHARSGLPAIALRPARIYGPFSRTFTVRPLTALRSNGLVLAGDADTPANMVYVDNVVEAILRSLDAPAEALGEAYLVSEADQLSWRDFYAYFAAATGAEVQVRDGGSASSSAAPRPGWFGRWVQGGRQIVFSPELRALAKKVMWTDPYGVWPRRVWDRSPNLQQRVLTAIGVDAAVVYREPPPAAPEEVVFRVDPTLVVFDKAATRLGYVGAVPRERGMALTLEWARAARLL